jgi:hypothetical protein
VRVSVCVHTLFISDTHNIVVVILTIRKMRTRHLTHFLDIWRELARRTRRITGRLGPRYFRCVFVCVCVRARVRVRACVCVVCVHVYNTNTYAQKRRPKGHCIFILCIFMHVCRPICTIYIHLYDTYVLNLHF